MACEIGRDSRGKAVWKMNERDCVDDVITRPMSYDDAITRPISCDDIITRPIILYAKTILKGALHLLSLAKAALESLLP